MSRFSWVQKFEEFTDYDTALGGCEAAEFPNESVRRLTIVRGDTPYAYLTMADYSEKEITVQEAERLLEQ